MAEVVVLEPASQSAQEMFDIGYRPLYVPTGHGSYVHVCFHATTPKVIEIQSVSAHPAKHGHATAVLRRVFQRTDRQEAGVTW